MTESETLMEHWDRLGEDKTELLEELILVQSDDVGKLDVNEVMLRYFENRQRLGCDTWDNDNQALRQLFSASCRVPRVRHFPGSAGRVVGNPTLPAGRRRMQPPLALAGRATFGARGRQAELPSQAKTAEQLAEHLIAAEETYEGIERELAALSEQLVAHSLSQAVYNSAVHQLALRLVRRALDRASEQLGARVSSGDSSTGADRQQQQDARIDRIAQELARSNQERGDPRELTFASERAESVAEGLLDQLMADAAQVVGGDGGDSGDSD